MDPTALTFSLLDWCNGLYPGVLVACRLFLGTPDLSAVHAISDLTEADFEGYEEQDVSVDDGPPYQLTGDPTFVTPFLVFNRLQAVVTPNTVGGYFLVAEFPDDSEVLIVAEAFSAPVEVDPASPAFGVCVFVLPKKLMV